MVDHAPKVLWHFLTKYWEHFGCFNALVEITDYNFHLKSSNTKVTSGMSQMEIKTNLVRCQKFKHFFVGCIP